MQLVNNFRQIGWQSKILTAANLMIINAVKLGVCNCSMFCCMLLYVHSSVSISLIEKRGLVAWLSLSFWCLMIVVWLFLAVPWVYLQFVIVVFSGHTCLFFFINVIKENISTMCQLVPITNSDVLLSTLHSCLL